MIDKCGCCNYATGDCGNYRRHLKSIRHHQKCTTVSNDMTTHVSSSSHSSENSGHLHVNSGHFQTSKNVEQPTTPNKKKYICDKCGKSYTDKSNMYRHQRSEMCKN